MKKAQNGNSTDAAPIGFSRPRTQGEAEAAISRSFIQFEKANMGRGPLETRTYLIDDLVIVRLKGVLTPSEQRLAEVAERGVYLIKQARLELLHGRRAELEATILDLLGVGVRSLHTDTCASTGEKVVVISLQQRPAFPEGVVKAK
ncbi:MAG: DUF2294 domain-containing protein [Gemmataceae bacterium]